MSFSVLTAAQFAAFFMATAAIVVLLYLLDRSKRRRVVPTLRFWRQAAAPVASRQWRIREPWSLLLQLLGLLFLLLALAGLQTGDPAAAARDHIVILDASAWMAYSTPAGPLMDQVRERAQSYVRSLPPEDRVMVIRGDALPTPLTGFEAGRATVQEAIQTCEPGAAAIDVGRTLDLARRLQTRHSRRPGEVVYIGAGRTQSARPADAAAIPNLRYIPVEAPGAIENAGLRRAGLRHSDQNRNEWDVYVAVGNDGAVARAVEVSAQFAGAPAVFRRLELTPGGEQEIVFPLRTQAGGELEIAVFPEDDFPADNRTRLRLPARAPVRIAVYSRSPERLRPLLEASPMVSAQYLRPGDPPPAEAELLILHQCEAPEGRRAGTIWIAPPESASPVRVAGRTASAAIERWNPVHPVSAGLRTQNLDLGSTLFFGPDDGISIVASAPGGPVIVASEEERFVALGFDPAGGDVRYRLGAPLLFANILRWMRPEVFRQWEMNLASVGVVSLPAPPAADRSSIAVIDEQGDRLPFALDGDTLRFYSGRPGQVRVVTGEREVVFSLGLPRVPESEWEAPEDARRGVPPPAAGSGSKSLWPWLALAGALAFAAEWLLYGRGGRAPRPERMAPEAERVVA